MTTGYRALCLVLTEDTVAECVGTTDVEGGCNVHWTLETWDETKSQRRLKVSRGGLAVLDQVVHALGGRM